MIAADRLTKCFGDKVAVDKLTFAIEKGEVVGFLGPNAAGKTTTMRILTCYFPPTEGNATVAGYDVYRDSTQVRRNVGYLPELVPLYPEMTVREYLEFATAAKGMPHADRKAAVNRAIERCNLDSVEHQLIGTISRGFRQRVGLGQAIINEPPVLILDEPTVGLDPAQIREIRELIRELAGKSTVILSTHILSEVSVTCSRVIIISRGRIQAQDTPQNLAARKSKVSSLRLDVEGGSGPDEVRQMLSGIKGVETITLHSGRGNRHSFRLDVERDQEWVVRPELARAVVEKGWGLMEMSGQEATLEDVFLDIVRSDEALAEGAPAEPLPVGGEA